MGLPAFKMEVFEEARSAAMSAPRVTSTIFMGSGGAHSEVDAETRRSIRKDVDTFVASIDAWRIGAIKSVATARKELQDHHSLLSVSHMRKLIADLDRHISVVEAFQAETSVSDRAVIEHLRSSAETAAVYAPAAGKFLKREVRRVAEACDQRQRTLSRNRKRMLEIQNLLREAAERESVPSPDFASDEERDTYVEQALKRPPDIEGTEARARRMLARFPKTTAYLAR